MVSGDERRRRNAEEEEEEQCAMSAEEECGARGGRSMRECDDEWGMRTGRKRMRRWRRRNAEEEEECGGGTLFHCQMPNAFD